jgi:hypothetical protein
MKMWTLNESKFETDNDPKVNTLATMMGLSSIGEDPTPPGETSTACAGRATPRVVSTLVTANAAAARQRNKDGFLPLHLAAHWGVSHISVAVQLLRTYPDATVGRNRWERTPLEEALCMAGENGRPHQAALVKALRKHPSWWTRPDIDALGSSNRSTHRRGGGPHRSPTIVDVDESLASGDTMEEQLRLHQQRLHQEYFEDDDE